MVDLFGSSRARGVEREFDELWYFLKNEPEVTRRILQHFYTNWLRFIDKPRHARPAQSGMTRLFQKAAPASPGSPELPELEIESCIQRSPIAGLLMPALSQFDDAIGREQARQAALEIVLATQIYRREKGEFPEQAEDLLDGILDELPADPFGKAGEAMRYRRDREGFTVWSIGPNETDDGGDFTQESFEYGDVGFEVTEEESPAE